MAAGIAGGMLDVTGERRCGVYRPSQDTNVLLIHSQLGKMKQCTFAKTPDPDFVFGVSKPRDPEGAREVSMKWVQHEANPDDKPGPDFISMNKSAAIAHRVTSQEQTPFRHEYPITLKRGDTGNTLKKKPLPSDRNPDFVYGRKSEHRPLEETRLTGGDVDIKNLVQGAYTNDWTKMNLLREAEFQEAHLKPLPKPTKASAGHAAGAKAAGAKKEQVAAEPFKMKKFKSVKAKLEIPTGK